MGRTEEVVSEKGDSLYILENLINKLMFYLDYHVFMMMQCYVNIDFT